MKAFPLLILSVGLLLSSCVAHKPGVTIRHYFLDSPQKEAHMRALNSVYLVMEKPHSEVNADDLARTLAGGIERIDGGVLAYRIVDNVKKKDPYVRWINPTAILTVEIGNASCSEGNRTEKETVYKLKGEKEEVETTITTIQCYVSGNLVLASYPDQQKLVEAEISASVERRKESTKEPAKKKSKNFFAKLDRFLESKESGLKKYEVEMIGQAHNRLMGEISNRISPAPMKYRNRPVYFKKEDKESKEAYKLLKQGKPREAEAVWKKRVEEGRGSWKDQWNLAVAAEALRDYDRALKLYQAVKIHAEGHDKAIPEIFDGMVSDLENSHYGRQKLPPSATPWFDPPLAVLPLSDEVVSIEGDGIIRKILHDKLKRGGYNTIPLEDIDEKLRLKGFSDAGQFPVTTKRKLASWVGAKRLVMGHITEYDEVNVGVYRSRSVAGNLFMWSKKTGKKMWEAENKVKNSKLAASGSKILANFFGGLGKGFVERIKNKPLAQEAELFVRQSLEGLPFKP